MSNNLNPSRETVQIGKRELRTIEILPLSIADQFRLSDVLNEAIRDFAANMDLENLDDKAFIARMLGIVKKNLRDIMELVAFEDPSEGEKKHGDKFWEKFGFGRKKKSILDDITNDQGAKIVEIIYRANYESLIKKVTDLLIRNPNLGTLLRRSSQVFSDDTLSGTSTTFTEGPIEMEDLPLDN